MNPEPIPMSEVPTAAPVVRVIGVGGAGGRLVHALVQQDPTVSAVAVDTDAWALRRLDGLVSVTLGESVLRGLGCGGDAVQAANVAELDQARLKQMITGTGLLVLVVGMGGGAGSGIAPVVARSARESGWNVVVLAAMPFDFEGPLRRANAHQGMTALRNVSDLIIPFSHQGLMRATTEFAGAGELRRWADGFVLGVARELLRLLSGEPLIPLGIADLATMMRDCRTEGVAAAVEAVGENRAAEVWRMLCSHPLLDSRPVLAEAGAVVLQLAGGPDLKVDELEWLEGMVQKAAPNAEVRLGAVTQPILAGRLTALLVVAPEARTEPASQDHVFVSESGPSHAREAARKEALMFQDLSPVLDGSDRRGAIGGAERRIVGAGRGRNGAKTFQQQFDFAPRWRGRFEGVEGTLRAGENLDEPTFARRGVRLN